MADAAALPGGIAIAGPTATGKSELALRIAGLLPVETCAHAAMRSGTRMRQETPSITR